MSNNNNTYSNLAHMKMSQLLDSSLDDETETEEDEMSTTTSVSTKKEGQKQTEVKEMAMVINIIHLWMEKWNLLSKQVEENNLTIEILMERTQRLRHMEQLNDSLAEENARLTHELECKEKVIEHLKCVTEKLQTLEKTNHFLQRENHDLTRKIVEANLIM